MRVCQHCDRRFKGDGWRCPGCGFAPAIADGIPVLAPPLAAGNPADAAYLHDDLAAAETRHFWFAARNRLILAALDRHFPAARTFFDLGCGTGGVLAAIDRHRGGLVLSAGDALLAGLARAQRRVPRASCVQLDVRRLPYDDEFDVIGLFDVLEHLDDDEGLLREVRRATRSGGGVIITVPQHPWLWSAIDAFSHHRRRYTRAGLLETVRRAGFTIERATSFMTFVLPALLLARLTRHDGEALDAAAELRIGSVPNAVLRGMCRLEAMTLAAGCSWPVGGSLLVVARARDEA